MRSLMLTSALLPRKCAQTLLAVALRPSQAGRGCLRLKLASAAFLLTVKLGGVASSVASSQLACLSFVKSAFCSLSYGEQDLMVSSDYYLRTCLLGPMPLMQGATADGAICGTSNMRAGGGE